MRQITSYIVTIILLITHFSAKAQVYIRIPQPFTDTLLCKGGTLTLAFICDTDEYFAEGNLFKAILSDAYGNFSNPTQIGQLPGRDDGSITCTIPTGIQSGTGYRIRITANNPSYTSADNGINIRISPYPVITASSNSPVCPSGTLNFTGSSSQTPTTYSWSGPLGYNSIVNNPSIPNPPVNRSGIYTLRGTAYGCTSEDTAKVSVVDPAKPIITGATTICEGGALGLDANIVPPVPGLQPLWTGPAGHSIGNYSFQRYNFQSSYVGYYTITYTIGTCSKKDSVYVNLLPRPDTTVITSNDPVCMGDTLQLKAVSPSPGITYHWTGPNGYSSTGQQNPEITNVPLAAAGTYTSWVSFIASGCTSIETKKDIIIGQPIQTPIIKGDTVLCGGEYLKLLSVSNTIFGQFTWTTPTGQSVIAKSYNVNSVKNIDAGTYYLTQSYQGCTSPVASVLVDVTEVPVPVADNNGPLCDGATLQLMADHIDQATYSWTGPSFTSAAEDPVLANATVAQSGTYTVVATLKNCTNTSFTNVVINPIPEIVQVSSNVPACSGGTATLYAESNIPGSTYNWQGPANYQGNVQSPVITANATTAGMYTVRATAKGCTSAEDTAYISIKPSPGLPVATSNSPVQEGERLELSGTCSTPGVSFEWVGANGFKDNNQNTFIERATSVNAGTYMLTAILDGCKSSASTIVVIRPGKESYFTLFPNPASKDITLSGIVQTEKEIKLSIVNAIGQVFYKDATLPVNKKLDKTIDIGYLPNGNYTLNIITEKDKEGIPFVIMK